jgi:hypothetical protein
MLVFTYINYQEFCHAHFLKFRKFYLLEFCRTSKKWTQFYFEIRSFLQLSVSSGYLRLHNPSRVLKPLTKTKSCRVHKEGFKPHELHVVAGNWTLLLCVSFALVCFKHALTALNSRTKNEAVSPNLHGRRFGREPPISCNMCLVLCTTPCIHLAVGLSLLIRCL